MGIGTMVIPINNPNCTPDKTPQMVNLVQFKIGAQQPATNIQGTIVVQRPSSVVTYTHVVFFCGF